MSSKPGLQNWVKSLKHKNMPVLGSVIAELNKITGSDESNANQLAEVILRDPNLTSHVLRVANSVQYNYGNQKINTVSRATILIGIKGVRAICISLMILDRLLVDEPKERVLGLIAQGFHAATQAKRIFDSNDHTDAEEVFIAGLLYNLGEMAFWMSEDVNEQTGGLLSEDPKARAKAMEQVLGTSFKAITRELSGHWKLGETVERALFPSANPGPKVKSVIIGERLSRAALYGWDSPQIQKVAGELAEFKGITLDDAMSRIKKGADQASDVAESYGVAEARPMIPSSTRPIVRAPIQPKSKILVPDPALQLSILRELSSAARDKTEVNTIFQMVIEGMHRGVGLERVAVAFIKGHKLKAKYVLGEGAEHWRSSFLFDIGPYSDNVFTETIETGDACWYTEDDIAAKDHLFPQDVVRIIGRIPSFTFVLNIADRKAALFYADRWNHGGKLEQDQFDSFKHFAQQAQQSLIALSRG
ncbi:MAG: HD-like signal output (HDOD) protein [Flavobacteriales bacterium]|jgi:HD-like signal output (HDOD) protein